MSKRKDETKPEIAVATPDEVAELTGAASGDEKGPAQPDGDAGGAEPSLAAERDEWREKALRARADYQNLRRRNETERQEAIRFAQSDFARGLLVVFDDLGRAMEASNADADRETLVRSIEMIRDHFRKALSDQGISTIDAQSQPFDPARHQAFQQQPSSDHEPGTVIHVVEPGYLLHDRVLRPARVIVSCAPTPAKDTTSASPGDEETDDHADV